MFLKEQFSPILPIPLGFVDSEVLPVRVSNIMVRKWRNRAVITRHNHFLLSLSRRVRRTIHSGRAHQEQLEGRGWLGRRP